MKRKFLLTLLLGFIPFIKADAGVSVYPNYSTVTKGSTVTFTVKLTDAAAWSIKGSSSGATNGCSINEADTTSDGKNATKYFNAYCEATEIGQIGFTVTGNYTSDNGTTFNISQGTSVNVVKPREKDSNNYLSSLEVEGHKLEPDFNKDTLEYKVKASASTTKININASKESNYADDPTGVGEFEVSEGTNSFEVKVKSETGIERTYKIIVEVKDDNPIKVNINDKNYNIMKNLKDVKVPDSFKESKLKIKEIEVPILYSETLKITLVGLKDEKGNIVLADYDKDNNTYKIFNQNESTKIKLYVLDIKDVLDGFYKDKVTINGEEYSCLRSNNDHNLVVIYARNLKDGKENYYEYDNESNNYIIYHNNLIINYSEESKKYKQVVILLTGGLFFSFLIIILLIFKRNKKRYKKPLEEDIEKIKVKEIKKNKKVDKKEKKKTKKDKEEDKDKDKDKDKELEKTKELDKDPNKALEIIDEFENKKDNDEDTAMFDILEEDNKKKKRKKRV